jgi:hypothetical protein
LKSDQLINRCSNEKSALANDLSATSDVAKWERIKRLFSSPLFASASLLAFVFVFYKSIQSLFILTALINVTTLNRVKCVEERAVRSVAKKLKSNKAQCLLVFRGLERVKGIEPSSQPWEGHILPLNHTRKPRLRQESRNDRDSSNRASTAAQLIC